MGLMKEGLVADALPMLITAERDAWRRQALCVGHPDRGAWFSEDPEAIRRAVAVCRACPVRFQCLCFAIDTREDDGIWGGVSPAERHRIRRSMAAAS